MNLFSIARRVFGLGPNINAASPLAMTGLGSSLPVNVEIAPAPVTSPAPRVAVPQATADGPTKYQLAQREERKRQLAFGFGSKMLAARTGAAKEQVQLDYIRYCEALESPAAPKAASTPAPSPAIKAATPAPATDDDGVPVPTKKDDDDPDGTKALIAELLALISVLRQKLNESDSADETSASAKRLAAAGKNLEAIRLLADRAHGLQVRADIKGLKGRDKTAAAFTAQLSPNGKKPWFPSIAPVTAAPVSAARATNESFKAKLAAVNAEINLAASKGKPVTNDMLSRRRAINSEWQAFTRSKK